MFAFNDHIEVLICGLVFVPLEPTPPGVVALEQKCQRRNKGPHNGKQASPQQKKISTQSKHT